MRLSGTYLDRLLINVLPFTFIGSLIIHFAKKSSLEITLLLFGFTTLLFWALDSLFIFFKRLKTLRMDNGIYLDEVQVSPKDIIQIIPVSDSRRRWEFKTIKFIVKKEGSFETISVMEKPRSIIEDIMGKKSKTLGPLFEEFPELRKKLEPPQED